MHQDAGRYRVHLGYYWVVCLHDGPFALVRESCMPCALTKLKWLGQVNII